MLPIEEEDTSPEVDCVFVALREVLVEAGEEQLLDPRVTFRAAECLGWTHVRAQRIHWDEIIPRAVSLEMRSTRGMRYKKNGRDTRSIPAAVLSLAA